MGSSSSSAWVIAAVFPGTAAGSWARRGVTGTPTSTWVGGVGVATNYNPPRHKAGFSVFFCKASQNHWTVHPLTTKVSTGQEIGNPCKARITHSLPYSPTALNPGGKYLFNGILQHNCKCICSISTLSLENIVFGCSSCVRDCQVRLAKALRHISFKSTKNKIEEKVSVTKGTFRATVHRITAV